MVFNQTKKLWAKNLDLEGQGPIQKCCASEAKSSVAKEAETAASSTRLLKI